MAPMRSFISSYHLPFTGFHQLLTTSNALVAGSSALALYLTQEGVAPGFEPNDMDIWMEDTHSIFMENGHINQQSNIMRFTQFLLTHGYNISTKYETESYENIRGVYSFLHPTGREIQLVVIHMKDVVEYVKTSFDLSVCATWWNAHTDRFETLSPETTLQRKMHTIPCKNVDVEKLRSRIQKYTHRGFIMIDPPFIVCKDTRNELGLVTCELRRTMAHDVWSLEDVNAAEYLQASAYHILVKAGQQFYAFHRETLCHFMKHRYVTHPVLGELYETPHNHSIIKHAFVILPYMDYSIYEIVLDHNMQFAGKQRSVCTVKCFTIREWMDGTCGAFFPPVGQEVMGASVLEEQLNALDDIDDQDEQRIADFYLQEVLLGDIYR